jgi:drug/metabolite transporter (DMT)-like permease
VCPDALLPASKPASLATLDPLGIGLLLFTVFNTLVAYGAFAEALAHVEASRVSLVLALTPLLTIGFVHLGARLFPTVIAANGLPPIALLGAGLVVAGSALAALRRRSGGDR